MKRCKRILIPEIADTRGKLMFAEDDRHIPFRIRRLFAIYDVPSAEQRGAHAHRNHHQFLIMLNGACVISINEGNGALELRSDSPTKGLYVPPLVWMELRDFTIGAVCLVLASDHFDEADYIRDFAEFQRLVATEP